MEDSGFMALTNESRGIGVEELVNLSRKNQLNEATKVLRSTLRR
jgi:hypothetical protein